ncbi:MAG: hypothetical protein HYV63_10000 [Candidatus Schekmanbacteria bacterium]|nr:hypothetical protein [Candidatus Schekmanbacteria bacterium]
MRRSIGVLGISAIGIILLTNAPAPARAGWGDSISGADEKQACACAPAHHNAGEGALMTFQKDGPLGEVQQTAGSHYTHVALSLGSPDSVVHSTMAAPAGGSCSNPIDQDQLTEPYPGVSQMRQGGLYAWMYIAYDDAPDSNVTETPRYWSSACYANNWTYNGAYSVPSGCTDSDSMSGSDMDDARASADWFDGRSSSYKVEVSSKASGRFSYGSDAERIWMHKVEDGGTIYEQPYSLYTFVQNQNRTSDDTSSRHGMVCTTTQGWGLYKGAGRVLSSHTLSTSVVEDLAYQAWSSVREAAEDGLEGFSLADLVCWAGNATLAERAANQFVNCVGTSSGDCDDGEQEVFYDTYPDYLYYTASKWYQYLDGQGSTAMYGNLPDSLVGYGSYASSSYNSPWYDASSYYLSWNQGGEVCGCYF